MRRIDGKEIAKSILSRLKERVQLLSHPPKLSVILVGDDPASAIYVNSKRKKCEEVGIRCDVIKYDHIDEVSLLNIIKELNLSDTDGILVQLPLSDNINSQKVLMAIDPNKDVDGFHPINVGKLAIGEECFEPATAKGIIRLLREKGIIIEGKNAVVIGRSNIVGRPTAMMLLNCNASVTIVHLHSRDITEHTKRADIVVCAAGHPGLVTADMVKDGVVLVDVGINRVDGKVVGDITLEANEKASYYTPVPGGVGPMTIAMLLENVCKTKILIK